MTPVDQLASSLALSSDIIDRLSRIEGEVSKTNESLQLIWEEIFSQRKQIEACVASVGDLDQRVTALEMKLKITDANEKEIDTLKASVQSLLMANEEKEQYLRANNVEIKNIPFRNSENLASIVGQVAERVGFSLKSDDVDLMTRVATRATGPKPIIVKFYRRSRRDEFLSLAKKFGRLTTAHLDWEGKESIVYVNEHLTASRKALLTKTKLRAMEKGYKFVWINNCKILVRRNESSQAFWIRSDGDLPKIS
jgi:hypothetical protein